MSVYIWGPLVYIAIGVIWGRIFCGLVSEDARHPDAAAFWVSVVAWPVTLAVGLGAVITELFSLINKNPRLICSHRAYRAAQKDVEDDV
jgi:hypothetical protein